MSDKPVHYTSIHVQEARELLNDPDTVIIDIRDKVTFEAGNIPIPSMFRKRLSLIFLDPQTTKHLC